MRPFVTSRGLRGSVEYGSIEYSAVSHPPVTACSFIQRGTASSIVTAQITRVLPIDTSTEPLACGATFNSKLMARISSGARPSLRCIKEKLNAGSSLRDEELRRRKWRLLNHLVHPELRAASHHKYGDVAYPIDSQFGSNAGGLFTLHGPTICRSSALLSAGLGCNGTSAFPLTFTTTGPRQLRQPQRQRRTADQFLEKASRKLACRY